MEIENNLLEIHSDHYQKGNLKLTLQDQHYEPLAEISIDSNEISLLSNEFLLKNYSENEEIVKRPTTFGKDSTD